MSTIRGIIGLVAIMAGLHEPETVCPPQLDCAALSVWAEARGESFEGQIAVAEVVYKRGEPCDVIQQPGQFVGVELMPYPRQPWVSDPYGWRIALAAAWIAQERLWTTQCAGATHFYAHDLVTPKWAGESCVIGGHTFTTGPPPRRAIAANNQPRQTHSRVKSADDWTLYLSVAI